MRTGTPKMLDFLGLASQEAARKDLESTKSEGPLELVNVAAKGIAVK